ncbi:ABC transporter ATP-binding protein [Halotalea alkalilenta]|uniref:ABC transporter ATP-binding protein n=1 Tax=Halotalea alkalilenta TaxID=376489 RepID=UPI000694ABC1|nr:ABC transporter ATP-binding protein [Halotalea alkalilenta]
MQTTLSQSPVDSLPVRSSDASFLRLEAITKQYGSNSPTVDRLDLNLGKGQLLGLLGPSGCGKTTTLRMIAGLLPISAGRILIGDNDISHLPPHKRDIGLVFQNYALFPHMNVGENVAFGLTMRGIGKRESLRRAEEALETVRLPGLGKRRPKELSGGQQQRVALARALVIKPRLLLLDEPLSNLDAQLRDQMRIEIRDIQQLLGITTVFVTHDQTEALTMCDQVGVMYGGRLAQLGAPEEIYERPASMFVAQFVGRTNVLTGEQVSHQQVRIGGARYRCSGARPHWRGLKIAIRPHRISLTPNRDPSLLSTATNCVQGLVAAITYIGDVLQYEVDIGCARIRVETPTGSSRLRYKVGDLVMCEWLPQDMLAFEG